MEKLMTYDEIEKVYGLQPEKIGLWLSKGYIQGLTVTCPFPL